MSETVASPSNVPRNSNASGRGGGQGHGRSGSRGCGNRHGSRATTTPVFALLLRVIPKR
jgi:hypothetical protein